MLLPFVRAFSDEGEDEQSVPEIVPVDELTPRALEDAAAEIEEEPEGDE